MFRVFMDIPSLQENFIEYFLAFLGWHELESFFSNPINKADNLIIFYF